MNEGRGVRKMSQQFTCLVESFLLMISHFTKQGFCTTDLVTSIQSTTSQLRIRENIGFPNIPCLNKLKSMME